MKKKPVSKSKRGRRQIQNQFVRLPLPQSRCCLQYKLPKLRVFSSFLSIYFLPTVPLAVSCLSLDYTFVCLIL